MIKNPNTPFLATADLLELSLSIGKFHDHKKNATAFTSTLKKVLKLTTCEIWVKEKNANHFQRIFVNNRKILQTSTFEKTPFLLKFKENYPYKSTIISAANLIKLEGLTDYKKGVLYSIKLSDRIILLAYDSKSQSPFPVKSLATLEPFFSRFLVSIHHRNSRQKLEELKLGLIGTEQEIKKYKLVVENVSDGIIILNLDQEIVYSNQRLSDLTEYPIDEIIGSHVNAIATHKKMIPIIQANLKKVFKGQSYPFTIKHYRKISKEKWYANGKLTPYKDVNGKIIGAIATLRDISKEMAAQIELKNSKIQYNTLINNGFDGVIASDIRLNRVNTVNDKLLKHLNYNLEEFKNARLSKIAPKLQGNGISSVKYQKQINKEVQEKGTINYQWIHKKKDGSLSYMDVIAINLPAPNEHIKIEIHKDNTEKYLSQQLVKASEERMAKLFDLSPIPILIRSINSLKFRLVNKKFTELFGYSVEEINSKTREDLVYQENSKEIKSQMKKLMAGEISDFHIEKQYIRKDGTTFWGTATRSLVKFEDDVYLVGFIQDITERKKAIASMRESEAKLRAIFDSTSDKIVAMDRSFRIIDYNKTAEVFFKNYSDKRILKLGDKFLPIDPKFKKERLGHYRDALKGKSTSVNREYNFRGVDKVDLLNIFPIKDEKQNVIGVTLYGKDITELINTQSVLLKRENQLNEAQRIAKIGNWELDLNTEKFTWSQGAFRIFELSVKSKTPNFEEYSNMIHPNDLPLLLKSKNHILKQGKPTELEVRHFTNSGQLIYTIIKAEAIMNNGIASKIFGTIQDITSRKKVESELIESNKKYQDLFNNMYDALLVTDSEGYFLDANKAAQRLVEYSLDELKEMRIPEIVYPDDRQKSFEYLIKLQNEGFYSNYMGRIVTKSGKVKFLQVSSNAIMENGKMVGSRDIARDITLIKEAETKREQLYSQLEVVNNELKDFAYIVSHDLKAPLRAISSLSNWIAEDYGDLFDEEGKKHLSLLSGRANRMQNFIEGILEYSRLGRIKINKELVDIKLLLHNIIDSLDPPKQFLIEIAPDIPKIHCEKIRIQQVFQNLISNAIKYNDKDHGIIEIKYSEDKEFHYFKIKDNGIGIDERHYEKVFKIFQTLHPRDELESTGVGLTIVKRIIELYGGEINVKSKQGEGSVFSFSISKELSSNEHLD